MKEIELNKGFVTIVDDSWYDELSQYSWHLTKCITHKIGYATRFSNKKSIYMHRVIMDAKKGQQIDHINHNRCDNRIKNLRLATNTENHKNKPKQSNNKTGFVGVHWCNTTKRFRATIKVKGQVIGLGYRRTIIEAVILRMKANNKYGFHKNHGVL